MEMNRRIGFDPNITLGSIINLIFTLCGVVTPLLLFLHALDTKQELEAKDIDVLKARLAHVEQAEDQDRETAADHYRTLSVQLAQLQAKIDELRRVK